MLNSAGPLARFRLTRLADGGGILGLSFSHIIVDGHSGLHFSYVWSHNYEELAGNPLPGPKLPFGQPEFDRTAFRDAVIAPSDLPEEVRAQTQALGFGNVSGRLSTPGATARRDADGGEQRDADPGSDDDAPLPGVLR